MLPCACNLCLIYCIIGIVHILRQQPGEERGYLMLTDAGKGEGEKVKVLLTSAFSKALAEKKHGKYFTFLHCLC